jgi:hypothetical protein
VAPDESMNAVTTIPLERQEEGLARLRPRSASPGLAIVEHRGGSLPPDLLKDWQALVRSASEINCFAEPWFVAASVKHLAEGLDIRLLEIRDDEQLVGIIPLCLAPTYGRIPVLHVENWRHHHDFLGTPTIRAGHEKAFWAALLRHLDNSPWAKSFLHVDSLVEGGRVHQGLVDAAEGLRRECAIVHRRLRAALVSDLTPEQYFEREVRKKKRKELKRLRNRLEELGEVRCERLSAGDDLSLWCGEFLELERTGWKGSAGSALGCDATTEMFFREVLTGARKAKRLEFVRLSVGGRPIAMLVNFLAPPGGFSFKIAVDYDYARFSPGVLIQIENLQLLARGDIGWVDSCAMDNHSMIDGLWGERRSIVRVTVPLSGLKRRAVHRACRTLETLSAVRRAARKKA